MIAKGFVADLTLFLIVFFCIFIFYYVYRHNPPRIRNIPALDAIDEIVGRAAEMNRPIHVTTGTGGGMGGLFTAQAATSVAALSVLNRLVRACARYDVDLIATSPQIEGRGLITDVIEAGYRAEGALDKFNPTEQILIKSPYIYGWVANVLDIIMSKRVAANMALASVAGAAFSILETGARVGAIQFESIPGTGESTAFAAAVCDHITLGPEGFGIGAIASGEPEQICTLVGQDLLIFLIMGMTAAGVLLAAVNNPWLSSWLRT